MCTKLQYDSRQDALSAAQGMSRRGKGSFESYHCGQCGCYHVATRGKKPKHNRRDNNKYPFRYDGNGTKRKSKKFKK